LNWAKANLLPIGIPKVVNSAHVVRVACMSMLPASALLVPCCAFFLLARALSTTYLPLVVHAIAQATLALLILETIFLFCFFLYVLVQDASACKWRACRLCRGADLPHAHRARVCLACDCKDGAPSGVGKGHKGNKTIISHRANEHAQKPGKSGNAPPVGPLPLDDAASVQHEQSDRDSDDSHSSCDSVKAIIKADTRVSRMPSPITRSSLLSLSSIHSPEGAGNNTSAAPRCIQPPAPPPPAPAVETTGSSVKPSPRGKRREKLQFKSLLVSSSSSSEDDDGALLHPVSSPLRACKAPVQLPDSLEKGLKKPTRWSLSDDHAASSRTLTSAATRNKASLDRESTFSSSDESTDDDDDALLYVRLPWAVKAAAPTKRILAMEPVQGRTTSPRSPPLLRASSGPSKVKKCRRSPTTKGLGVLAGTTTLLSSESD